jgi:Lrp/AsnC family transcriptional regulator, leucine-responsive regulatory protein
MLPGGAEVLLMAGSTDYLLRVIPTDLEAYEIFLKRSLTRLRSVAHVRTTLSLSSLEAFPAPLTHLSKLREGQRKTPR